MNASAANSNGHRVVVIGGGFGGLQVVKHLRHAPVSVTLVDRNNYHLFQPLTYQVATGALSPGDVTYPLRSLFGSDANVRVALADVTGFDLQARKVLLESDRRHEAPKELGYDTLVVAAGSSYSYFGHDEWRGIAGEVKSLESALSVRARILSALERAELAAEPSDRDAETTFVIVGGGPTGVEIAGQVGELTRDMLARYFKHLEAGGGSDPAGRDGGQALDLVPRIAVREGDEVTREDRGHGQPAPHRDRH
jgi:NADH:ubiquinone reductase (H+-translocating)